MAAKKKTQKQINQELEERIEELERKVRELTRPYSSPTPVPYVPDPYEPWPQPRHWPTIICSNVPGVVFGGRQQ